MRRPRSPRTLHRPQLAVSRSEYRMYRQPALALCAAAHLAGSGCYRHIPLRPGTAPTPAADVRVRFAAPRELRGTTPDGSDVVMPGTREISGRVAAVRGDTLHLRLDTAAPRTEWVRGARVAVVPATGDRLALRRGQPGGTAVLVAAGLGTFILILLASTEFELEDRR